MRKFSFLVLALTLLACSIGDMDLPWPPSAFPTEAPIIIPSLPTATDVSESLAEYKEGDLFSFEFTGRDLFLLRVNRVNTDGTALINGETVMAGMQLLAYHAYGNNHPEEGVYVGDIVSIENGIIKVEEFPEPLPITVSPIDRSIIEKLEIGKTMEFSTVFGVSGQFTLTSSEYLTFGLSDNLQLTLDDASGYQQIEVLISQSENYKQWLRVGFVTKDDSGNVIFWYDPLTYFREYSPKPNGN